MDFKVISLLEPWATLKAIDAKMIETRSWGTKYRGPIYIHASKRIDKLQRQIIRSEPFNIALLPVQGLYQLTLGCIIARTEILNVVPITAEFAATLTENERAFGDYTPGRFAWIMGPTRRLVKPVPINGRLGIWTWTTDQEPELVAK